MKIDCDDFVFAGRGTTALWAILQALNKPGARLLLPVNICEIVMPIIYGLGMRPVFYDVNGITGNAELTDIENAYTGTESILLAVHNFGRPVEINKIAEWAKLRGIFLIEDVCNALGGAYDGVPLGRWGDAAIFSFGYAKIIDHGVGGAALAKDPNFKKALGEIIGKLDVFSEIFKNGDAEFQNRVRVLRKDQDLQKPAIYIPFYAEYAKYLLYSIGQREIDALQIELNGLTDNISLRFEKAEKYRKMITAAPVRHCGHTTGQVYWRYNILVDREMRAQLLAELRKNDILASTWYPPIAHLFLDDIDRASFKNAYSFGDKVLNLFVDSRIDNSAIEKTCSVINHCL